MVRIYPCISVYVDRPLHLPASTRGVEDSLTLVYMWIYLTRPARIDPPASTHGRQLSSEYSVQDIRSSGRSHCGWCSERILQSGRLFPSHRGD